MDTHLPTIEAHATESGAEPSRKAAVLIDFASARAAQSDSSEPDLTRNLRVAGDNLQLLADMLDCLAVYLTTGRPAGPGFQRYLESLIARRNLVLAACADAAARRAQNQPTP